MITDECSNASLGVLKAGIPVLPLSEFSVFPDSRSDMYGFAKNKVIPQPVTTVRGVSLEQLAQFYSKDWAQRFERYDASYSVSAELLVEQARKEILRVMSTSQPGTKP